MSSLLQSPIIGKTFVLVVPQSDDPESPYWLCQCTIERMTEFKTLYRVIIDDWYNELVPIWDNDTQFLTDLDLWAHLNLTLGAARQEFLCTM